MLTDEQREALEVALAALTATNGTVALGAMCVIKAMLAASAAPADGREAFADVVKLACESRGVEFDIDASGATVGRLLLWERNAALATAPTMSEAQTVLIEVGFPQELKQKLSNIAMRIRFEWARWNKRDFETLAKQLEYMIDERWTERIDRANAEGRCKVDKYSSRVCERGTLSCTVYHNAEAEKS